MSPLLGEPATEYVMGYLADILGNPPNGAYLIPLAVLDFPSAENSRIALKHAPLATLRPFLFFLKEHLEEPDTMASFVQTLGDVPTSQLVSTGHRKPADKTRAAVSAYVMDRLYEDQALDSIRLRNILARVSLVCRGSHFRCGRFQC
jgi:hypothetical protein